MNLKALQYFMAAARYGSIVRAAQHLHVAQPAVSRLIRKLERDLGVRLLDRTAQGVTPTEQGAHLLARTEPILQLLAQTRAEVRNWDEDPSGPVSVALMPGVAPVVAPPLARQVRERFPKVRLSLSEGLGGAIAGGVLAGQFDLGLFHADRDVPLLAVTRLLEEPLFLIGPAADGGGKQGRVRFEDLPGYPLLLPEPPNPLRRMIDDLTGARGLALDIRETVNSIAMIKAMVGMGLGYTVQGYSFFRDEIARGDPAFRAREIEGMSRNWSLAVLADRPLVGAVSAVAGVVSEIAAELAETRPWRPPAIQ
ncbi:MAG: hypothetical protein COW30_01085 [Rhodospirillales bacterium CG15_BIG_FIL_POST_REV_8_21_14_020_66_15]|nr:MAG: hypothetical protein COW30_01085 [Rhodospirillales bacterium CG15_BIG_FIL_POST_REV_8_21_14_020_66_15]